MTHPTSPKKTDFSVINHTLKSCLLLLGLTVFVLPGNLRAHFAYGPEYDCSQCHTDGRTWQSIHGGGTSGGGTSGGTTSGGGVTPVVQASTLAQLVGTINPGNSAYPGGKLYYQYALQTKIAGKAVINYGLVVSQTAGAKWNPTTPSSFTTNVIKGVTPISSPAINIPSDFIGNVTLRLSIAYTGKFNKVTIAAIPVNVMIAPPSSFYDVGFGNTVTLNASGISIAGMGSDVSYTWTQKTNSLGNITPGGNLSSTNGKIVTLTTGLTQLVDTNGKTPGIVGFDNEAVENSTYVYEVKVSGKKITRTGTFTVSCAAQSPATSRSPQLIGTNGTTTNTGSYLGYLGTNCSRTAIGVNVCYLGSNWTIMSQPSNSTATLTHTNDGLSQLRPDVAGVYVLANSYSNGTNIVQQVITNTAASYVGSDTCYGCHGPNNPVSNKDLWTPWSGTGHATMAQWALDGGAAGYNESCLKCHTLGYNQSTNAASNGNFKAVANQHGWKFPAKLKVGNYDGMPDHMQELATIQCESCHGPGAHISGAAAKSLDVQVCATCHQDGDNYNTVAQWKNNPHNAGYNSISLAEGVNAGCARCHSPSGFTYVAKQVDNLIAAGTDSAVAQTNVGKVNVPTNNLGTGPLTCQTCHDPHDSFGDDGRHQLRIAGTVVIGDLTKAGSVTLTNVGNSAACMICHNSRRLAEQAATTNSNSLKYYQNSLSGPHRSPVAEVFTGNGAPDCTNTMVTSYYNYTYYTNGIYDTNGTFANAMGNSAHSSVASCQTCHMYQLLDVDGKGKPQDMVSLNGTNTPVTHALYKDLSKLVGDHTFSVRSVYSNNVYSNALVQNVAACNQCHKDKKGNGVTSFDLGDHYNSVKGVVIKAQDYDGDGQANGIQTETLGLLGRVASLITNTGIVPTMTTNGSNVTISGFTTTGLASTNNITLRTAQQKAVWNWLLISNDGSKGVHNAQFTIRVLQSAWTDLNTSWTNNPSTNTTGKTFIQAYPNAVLR